MQLFVCLLVLIPLASLNPVTPKRVYVAEEDDPAYYNRNFYFQDENGTLIYVDVQTVSEVLKDVGPDDVSFDLYNTRKTAYRPPYTFTLRTLDDDIFRSYFDSSKLTVFVSHGWKNDRHSAINQLIKDALLEGFDLNVIIVDWSYWASSFNYLTAKSAVPGVGKLEAQLVNKIQSLFNLDGTSFILIGHSLGAHVAGHAGKNINQKVEHIIGLDPAGPGFSYSDKGGRLSDTDANVVQVIHTNGGKLGFMSAIGSIDYYPNGGSTQAGCGLDLIGTCSHSRAYEYLAEALIRGLVFKGYLCSDYTAYKYGQCDNNPVAYMGQLIANKNDVGDFFLDTRSKPPYGQGQ